MLHGQEEEGDTYKASSSTSSEASIYAEEAALEEAYSKGEPSNDPYNEHIYEEIHDNKHRVRPLPPIPEGALAKSIFTGATKYEILHYLQDARQRMEGQLELCEEDGETESSGLGSRGAKLRVSAGSSLSDSSSSSGEGEGVLWRLERLGRVEVERNDSGVGSDSGHSGKEQTAKEVAQVVCPDCELAVVEGEERLCSKCRARRGERKEIILEIVETEGKYGRDLRIVVEEFYRPMLVAGLLSSDQLAAIFLNVEQLIQVGDTRMQAICVSMNKGASHRRLLLGSLFSKRTMRHNIKGEQCIKITKCKHLAQVNSSFCVRLKEAVDSAQEAGDPEFCSVAIGGLFIQALPMLQAFEAYCTKQVGHETTGRKEGNGTNMIRNVSSGCFLDAAGHHGEGEGAIARLPQGLANGEQNFKANEPLLLPDGASAEGH